MSHEDAINRANMAMSFVEHPYWNVMSKMLSGTIKAETEEMLAGDSKLALNRASVAICRKILQAPFFDIEQGKIAQAVYIAALRKTGTKGPTEDKEKTPWLREVGR